MGVGGKKGGRQGGVLGSKFLYARYILQLVTIS